MEKKSKIVRKIKVKKVTQVVNHDVARRKNLKKFGNAINHGPGPNPSTTNIGEEVIVKLSLRPVGAADLEEENQSGLDSLRKKKRKTGNLSYVQRGSFHSPLSLQRHPWGFKRANAGRASPSRET